MAAPPDESGATRVRVARGALLPPGQSQTFEYEQRGQKLEGFLLRRGGSFYAYANICPHWNVDLDLGSAEFYAEDLDRIICKNHGALFRPETGECTAGPCAGAFLERFEVTLEGDDAFVTIAPPLLVGGG